MASAGCIVSSAPFRSPAKAGAQLGGAGNIRCASFPPSLQLDLGLRWELKGRPWMLKAVIPFE